MPHVFWIGTRILGSHIDFEGQLLEVRGQGILDLFFKVLPAWEVHAARPIFIAEDGVVGHLPLYITVQNMRPFLAEPATAGLLGLSPASDLLEQRPVCERQVLVHLLGWIVRKYKFHGISEDFAQMDVDRPRRAVIVHI